MYNSSFTDHTGRVLAQRYRLDEIVGIGGMAIVYKAYDLVDNKNVAVKIVRDEFLGDENLRNKFRTESIAIASLRHRNIVKVYDVNLGEKLEYIVMEYVDGISLKEYLQQHGTVSWQKALEFTEQILSALSQAHQKNIIHRDIKPGNIMLLRDNKTIKVADFGIALVGRQALSGVMKDDNFGSVKYTSPEQALAAPGKIDFRTDIYSVGILMYEMTTGSPPFNNGTDIEILKKQIGTVPVSPREINKNIPAGVEQIIMHALEKNPDNRFSSAQEMLLDIQEFIRNPSASFNYKTVESAVKQTRNTVFQNEDNKKIVIQKEPSGKTDTGNRRRKNRIIPVMIGIITAILILITAAVWYFVARTKEIEIPDFVGKMYDDIQKDDEYAYFFKNDMIEANYVYTTDYDEGRIISQSISPGAKIEVSMSSSEVIRLNVAYAGSTMAVPEVLKNDSLKEVRNKLAKLGFDVKTEGVVDTSIEEGKVISMDPAPGTQLTYGATVTIFYAIADSSRKAMPNLKDLKEDTACAILDEMGFSFTVEYKTTTSSSDGLVIEQSVAADTPVDPLKTEVTITVGKIDDTFRRTSVSVTLPGVAGSDIRGNVYSYVNSELYEEKDGVRLNGGNVTMALGGSGVSRYSVYIDDQIIMEGTVDFSRSTPVVNTSSTYEYNFPVDETETTASSDTIAVPELIGYTQQEAVNALQSEGFATPKVQYEMSDSIESGKVIRVKSDNAYYTVDEAKNAEIILVISSGN